MNSPKISIIITSLNGAKTLNECLISLEKQTFNDFELVVVDAGSADSTVSIVNKSKIQSKVVCVVPGIGLYAGLNKGVELASGKWFYFMGCDDELYDTNTLQNVVDTIASIDDHYKVVTGNVEYTRQEFIFRPQLGSPYLLRYNVHHQGMFYNSDLFYNTGYNEELKISSDYEFNLKLSLRKVPHYYINTILCRIGEDGISNIQIRQSTAEINKIQQRLFSGLTRSWITNYFRLERAVIMARRRLGLVNLKDKLRRYLTIVRN